MACSRAYLSQRDLEELRLRRRPLLPLLLPPLPLLLLQASM